MNTNNDYNNAPMMDMVKFNQVEGIDLTGVTVPDCAHANCGDAGRTAR